MTGLSKTTPPSSSTSAGILPSGFAALSFASLSAGTTSCKSMSLPTPVIAAAIRALRTKGEAGEPYKIIIFRHSLQSSSLESEVESDESSSSPASERS